VEDGEPERAVGPLDRRDDALREARAQPRREGRHVGERSIGGDDEDASRVDPRLEAFHQAFLDLL
jgi:hypothetical protein